MLVLAGTGPGVADEAFARMRIDEGTQDQVRFAEAPPPGAEGEPLQACFIVDRHVTARV
jgi:hypothetical protein